MRARNGLIAIAALACIAPALPAHGAADPTFREFRLRHVCKGGANDGNVCCNPTGDCGTSSCVVDSIGKVSGVLTFVVDDDVSELVDDATVPGRRLKALTVMLETKGKNGVLIAQTFQGLDASSLSNLLDSLENGTRDEFSFSVTEAQLKNAVDTSGTGLPPFDVMWLVFRTLDPQTIARMRTNAGLPANGPEELVVQASHLKLDRWTDEVDSSFASVLRVKMNAYFVAPKGPPCP